MSTMNRSWRGARTPSVNGDSTRMQGEGEPVKFSPRRPSHIDRDTWDDRRDRLERTGTTTLFHATTAEGAQGIRQQGKLLRGKVGLAGGGIYFAKTRQEAVHKCRAKLSNPQSGER